MKKLLLASLLAGAFGSMSLPVAAQTIIVDHAPPPPREERVPHARHGYVWAPGHWEWRHGNHFWVRGSWMRERRGYSYHAPNWVERDGHWVMERGRWDRDGDGVPNRVDKHPNNPNRS